MDIKCETFHGAWYLFTFIKMTFESNREALMELETIPEEPPTLQQLCVETIFDIVKLKTGTQSIVEDYF